MAEAPGRILRDYEGEGIVVHWEPALCIHSANCVNSLPQVFNNQERPWINAGNAPAGVVATTIGRCPSGALRYSRNDGAPDEAPAAPATFTPQPDGPLYSRGDLEVVDAEGNVLRRATRLALCRCGSSQNKPYCDNSHIAAGFEG